MSIVRRDHPSLPEAKKAASSLQVMMLTPSELAKTAALDARSRRIPGEGVQESQGRSEERLDSEDRTFATRETVGGITTDFTLTASFVEAASDLETLISGVIAGKGPGEKRLRLS